MNRNEWHSCQINELAAVKGGKRLEKGEKFSDKPTPFPYIRVSDFKNFSVDTSNLKYLTPEIQSPISRYIINKEDVYISIAGTIGLVGAIPACLDGANLTENAARIVLNYSEEVDREFLVYYLASPEVQRNITARKSKNAQPKLALAQIKALEILLPPLNEQKKIAYVLSTVQRAIAQQEQLIQTTTELKKALMHKLFTEGLHGEKQKETAIGLVPESWDVVELSSCCELSTGTTPSTKNADYYVGNNPFIKTNQIVNSKISQAEILVSDEAVDKYNLKIFPPGTVLVAMYGQGKTRGQVALLDIAASITQNAGAITPRNSIIPEFLYYYLLSQYSRLRSSGMEGHISHLNLGFLGSFKIPLPSSIDEQKEIIRIIASLIKKIEVHASKRDVLQDLFQTLLHQLMTAQIRVHDIDLPGFDDLENITPQGSIQGSS
ncbi:MAG: restriction endonuclease subunit S [Drouetiella hepatica Uher 2000/2452]|jgi:type I restriction enzyme S subunit|uniref:Restriction endonuclease subunit S n=1 Tax=Drouetiella hepatica Uher 2000/2452 TaxID=904376 RepID=A0A951URP3_9CYAN|nr:restriction endonuclease subunit S [Drouetiella hepatica Uher 2000/2452]